MPAVSKFLVPPPALGGCLFGAILRDTRGAALTERERYNHFPASPLYALTHVASGRLHMPAQGARPDLAISTAISTAGPAANRANPASVPLGSPPADPRRAPTAKVQSSPAQAPYLAPFCVIAPQDRPTTSWSAGPVLALSVGVYPDAWDRLGAGGQMVQKLEQASARHGHDLAAVWQMFCASMTDDWRAAQGASPLPHWAGLAQIGDWSRALVARAAMAGPGRSLRAMERRLKRWSGQSRRSLSFYAAIEDLHRIERALPDAPLAQVALEAGYADQSHMGRALRRATGFSPARLNRLIETEEAFWCYRLLGERF